MSAIEILVNGEPLDLLYGEEERFYMTKQVHNLYDLETRNGEYSRSLTLPLSERNRRLLNYQIPKFKVDAPQAVNFIPCEVKIKSVPITPDGQLLITSQDLINKTVTATVFGGATLFFSQLSDEPISSLNLSEYDLEWTLSNLISIAGATDGICYPWSNWFSVQSARAAEVKLIDWAATGFDDIELSISGFVIFLHTIARKIFENLDGLTVDTSKMDANYFNFGLACAYSGIYDGQGAIAKYSQVRPDNYIGFQNANWTLVTFPIIDFDSADLWDEVNDQFILDESAAYEITLEVSGMIADYQDEQTRPTEIAIYRNGVEFQKIRIPDEFGNGEAPFNNIKISTTGDFSSGDIFNVFLQCGQGYFLAFYKVYNMTGYFSVKKIGGGTGNFCNVSDWLPDISQKEFIRNVFNTFNILATEAEGVVTLSYFEEIANEARITKPLDDNSPVDINAFIATYGQRNILKYTDNERVERLDANSQMIQNAKNQPDQVVKVELTWSATDDAIPFKDYPRSSFPNWDIEYQFITDNRMKLVNGSDVYETIDRNDLQVGDFIHYDQAGAPFRRKIIEVLTDFTGRMDAVATLQQDSIDWGLTHFEKYGMEKHICQVLPNDWGGYTIRDGGAGSGEVPTNGGSWARFNPICSFEGGGETAPGLKETYYALLERSIYNPLILVAWFDLGVIDFRSLNGLQTIYVPSMNEYFYVNKFEQWKYNQLCRLELFKLDL